MGQRTIYIILGNPKVSLFIMSSFPDSESDEEDLEQQLIIEKR